MIHVELALKKVPKGPKGLQYRHKTIVDLRKRSAQNLLPTRQDAAAADDS
jgi:hypothetical protein